MQSSPTSAAAARIPPCRTRRRASSEPPRHPADSGWTPPQRTTGAPSPMLKQTWTVSTPTVSVAGGRQRDGGVPQPRSVGCTRSRAARAAAATAARAVQIGDGATRRVVGVLHAQRGAQRSRGLRYRPPAGRPRGDLARPGVVRQRPRHPPANHAAVPAPRRGRERRRARGGIAAAGWLIGAMRLPPRAARRPQRVVRAEQPGSQLAHRGVRPGRRRRPRQRQRVGVRGGGKMSGVEKSEIAWEMELPAGTSGAHRGNPTMRAGPPTLPGHGSVTELLLSGDVAGPRQPGGPVRPSWWGGRRRAGVRRVLPRAPRRRPTHGVPPVRRLAPC
jgi:hypothetical protein